MKATTRLKVFLLSSGCSVPRGSNLQGRLPLQVELIPCSQTVRAVRHQEYEEREDEFDIKPQQENTREDESDDLIDVVRTAFGSSRSTIFVHLFEAIPLGDDRAIRASAHSRL